MYQIGLDLRGTEDGFKSHAARGTGRYIRGVVGEFQKLADPRFQFQTFYQNDLALRPWQRKLVDFVPAGKATLETQLFLADVLRKKQTDLIHFFAHGDAPARLGARYVTTVLDLIPLRFPELYKADKLGLRFRFARFLELESIKRSSGILAISEATKTDLQEILNVPAENIVVTPLAADERFFLPIDKRDAAQAVRRQYNLSPQSQVLLYVGGIDPRKNVPFLIEVFHEVVKRQKVENPVLLLVGKYEKNRELPALKDQIQRLGLKQRVLLTGFVPDAELPTHYAGASVSVFPSLYEGFGLPLVESLAVGTFVVCGSNSSLPEITGPEYPLLDGMKPDEWVRAIEHAMTDAAYRQTWESFGQTRASTFSWGNTAAKTLEAYLFFLERGR